MYNQRYVKKGANRETKKKIEEKKKMHRVTGYINEDMASERKKVPKMMEQSAEMSEQKLRQ